jgi:hypothetical protein
MIVRRIFLLLSTQTGTRVCDLDSQSLRPAERNKFLVRKQVIKDIPGQDLDALPTADVVGDLGSKAFVVHQQKVNLPNVVDEQLLQAVGENVPCLFVASVANLEFPRQRLVWDI